MAKQTGSAPSGPPSGAVDDGDGKRRYYTSKRASLIQEVNALSEWLGLPGVIVLDSRAECEACGSNKIRRRR